MSTLELTVLRTAIVCTEQVAPDWVWSYRTFQRDAGIVTGGPRTRDWWRR
jgi:hypothetical protein